MPKAAVDENRQPSLHEAEVRRAALSEALLHRESKTPAMDCRAQQNLRRGVTLPPARKVATGLGRSPDLRHALSIAQHEQSEQLAAKDTPVAAVQQTLRRGRTMLRTPRQLSPPLT